ncbi:iron-sulfur cluster biosynthesis transcriptional regulator SufR [Prochlorococcus sp. MIT 1300]|uniref:iron-sulfur cluster biosynthesis transcriptional regulator SufR n=1 Tax=Prochlorococcus sp. MIT 1300 TaxID=3096218 RepID=UPI002A762211|nr:iron-sulfur cluster biosynthesis transcriptional regulator SufR [Prochlorococcus sp. MIT 1300]
MRAKGQAPTREAILTHLLRLGESTALKLSGAVGVSVQAMRRHLRSLEEDGFVVSSAIVSQGPGRPFNAWQLTKQGHNYFYEGNEGFVVDLLRTMKTRFSPESINVLLNTQASNKANEYRSLIGSGTVSDRLSRLIELRRKEGYIAEYEPGKDGRSWYMNAFYCSIRNVAKEHPIICDQELQTIRQTFPDCLVERVHWRIECGHSCGFQITPV